MKKLIIASITALSLTACTDKIGYVDNAKLINGYQEKIDIKAKLDVQVTNYQKKRDSISQALQAEVLAFNKQAESLPESTRKKRYNGLFQKREILLQKLTKEEQELNAETQKQLDSLITKMKKNIREYGKKKGYSLIIGANDSGNLLYGSESKDITNDVLEYLNQQYKNK